MRLYQSTFSYEVDRETGNMSLLFPTLSQARSRTIELLRDEMQERIAGAEKYDNSLTDTDNLFAEISLLEVVPINAQSLCDIINSQGGRFVRSSCATLKIDLPAGSKRVRITKVANVGTLGT